MKLRRVIAFWIFAVFLWGGLPLAFCQDDALPMRIPGSSVSADPGAEVAKPKPKVRRWQKRQPRKRKVVSLRSNQRQRTRQQVVKPTGLDVAIDQIAAKKDSKTRMVSRPRSNVSRTVRRDVSGFQKWHPGSAKTKEYFMRAVWKLPSVKALSEEQQDKLLKAMLYDEYTVATAHDGWEVYEMTAGDANGRTYIVHNRVAELSQTGSLEVHVYTAQGMPFQLVHVLYCNNLVIGGPLGPRQPERPREEVEAPKEQDLGELPPIFVEKRYERKVQTSTHELDAGGGLWMGGESQGAWWFAQYKWFLESQAKPFAGGYISPVIGAFAKGDLGKTDAGYYWNNAGIGPQAGVMWNGITSKGYSQQVQVMLRTLFAHLHGENSSSGYHKDENHFMLGYYAEYLRRFHPEMLYLLYSEGWFDVLGKFKSTWSGDKITDLTSLTFGAKLHKDINEDWAIRIGAQIGFEPTELRVGGNIHAELRYKDWLIFGPTFDVNLISDIPEEVGNWTAGVFARVELKHRVIKKWTEVRMEAVKPAEIQLLDYADPPGRVVNPLEDIGTSTPADQAGYRNDLPVAPFGASVDTSNIPDLPFAPRNAAAMDYPAILNQ